MRLGEITIFNMTLRLEHIFIIGVALMFLYGCTLYSCKKVTFEEGFQMLGASLNYDAGSGIPQAWNKNNVVDGVWNPENNQPKSEGKSFLVKPDNMMSFFNETTFSPECCPSAYTSSGGLNTAGESGSGCACMSKEQNNYLNTRGGNKANTLEF